jgi:hypothetical protein
VRADVKAQAQIIAVPNARATSAIPVKASVEAPRWRCDQPTAVQVPSGLRQALPRATCGWPSI